MRRVSWLAASALALSPLAAVDSEADCERLKTTLKYTQEEAPRDLSALIPVVVERVNRVLDGVVDVDIEWTGADLHGVYGEHVVKCKVTRLAELSDTGNESDLGVTLDGLGRKVTSQCFHVPFTILDTDECKLPASHPMRHKCRAPAICVNTIGSYECICPRIGDDSVLLENLSSADDSFWQKIETQKRTPWEVSSSSIERTSCPGNASTYGCCQAKAHTKDGSNCRESFRCPVDPCNDEGYFNKRSSSQNNRIDTKLLHDCDSNAKCERRSSPLERPNFVCRCPKGLMGNGHACNKSDPTPKPMLMYDGVTPTDLTIKNDFYCGCTEPTLDVCSGFPPCEGKHETCVATVDNKPKCDCKPGFVMHETYGCVDVHPPRLKLRNDPAGDRTLRLKQGDEYQEYMVDIVDENAEDYFRSLKIAYSEPLPPSCLTKVGELHVNYTIAMPWASPPYVRVTRRVIVEDIDECHADHSKLKRTCPVLVPQCDVEAGAVCVNKIGSYGCRCPRHTSGDGFLVTSSFPSGMKPPSGYEGGTSCVDTSKPVITLLGPNPKVFKVCACERLSRVIGSGQESSGIRNDSKALRDGQRNLYEEDVKEMILSTHGAELCATHTKTNPAPTDCVKAVDHTYKGDIDLSKRVVVGSPVQKSPLHWAVPYDVSDDAGNKAATIWRDVVVQEVEISKLESEIRREILQEQEAITKRAIEKAVREERMKIEKAGQKSRSTKRGADCPPCPKCSCPSNPSVDKESCQKSCDSSSESCTASSAIISLVDPWLVQLFLSIITASAAVLAFNWVYKSSQGIFQSHTSDVYVNESAESLLRVHPDPLPPSAAQTQTPTAPSSQSAFFSPNTQSKLGSPLSSPPSNMNGRGTPRGTNRQQTQYNGGMFSIPGVSQAELR